MRGRAPGRVAVVAPGARVQLVVHAPAGKRPRVSAPDGDVLRLVRGTPVGDLVRWRAVLRAPRTARTAYPVEVRAGGPVEVVRLRTGG